VSDLLERRVRETLARRAARARVSGDAWPAIMARAARARRRQRAMRLSGALAAVAVLGLATPTLLDVLRRVDPAEVAFPPGPAPTAEQTPAVPELPAPESVASPQPPDPAAGRLVWTRAADPAGAFAPGDYVYVEDVAVLDGTAVAVGSFTPAGSEPSEPTRAAAWFSLGSQNWSLVEGDEAPFGGAPATYTEMLAISATGDRLVAVGGTYDAGQPSRPLAWVSPDARDWERVELPGEGTVRDVVWTGSVAVAVGEGAGRGPAAWTSADGRDWQAATVPGGGDSEEYLWKVAASGDRLVAMGAGGQALFVSTDAGSTWEAVPTADAGFDPATTAPEDVLALPDGGFLAVAVGDNGLQAYASDDGRTWTAVGAFPAGAGMQRVNGLGIAGDGAVVAVGTLLAGEGTGPEAAVWTSRDGGATWESQPDPEGAFDGGVMEAVASGRPGLVAVGHASSSASQQTGAAWTAVGG